MKKDNEKKQKIKVVRTTEGTIFELAFMALAIIVWVVVVLMLKNAPDVVATHFDATGHPNDYGSPWELLVPCVLTTVVGAGLLIGAYFPHFINVPVEVNNTRQYELLIRMTRISALLFLLLTLAIPATLMLSAQPSFWPVLCTIGLLLAVIIYYCFKIHKAK